MTTFDSTSFWEKRYRDGGNSGEGSMGENARWKADRINALVSDQGIGSVVEHGCGDGRQLALSEYPSYLGLDVSETAVELCRYRLEGREGYEFDLILPTKTPMGFDLSLSLDVAYHLPDDDVFARHMIDVFTASNKWVCLYTTDMDLGEPYGESSEHVFHRPVSAYVFAHFHDWNVFSTEYNEEDGAYMMVYKNRAS